MNKYKPYSQVLIFCILSVIIFLYFFHARTNTIYGDDLSLYRDHIGIKSILERMNIQSVNEKFRPIWGFVLNFIIYFFNIYKYFTYLFLWSFIISFNFTIKVE